jgi:hypothetical protein
LKKILANAERKIFKMRGKIESRKVKYKINPFLPSMPLDRNQRVKLYQRGDMMMALFKADTGEILENHVGGFWEGKEVDGVKFVKLFVNGIKALAELSSPGTKVFEVLYRKMQEAIGKDQIHMSFPAVDQSETPMSETTYWRGMNELIEKRFLATSHLPSIYWVNPDFVWNGDRIAFIREYYKQGSVAAAQFREQVSKQRQCASQFGESDEPPGFVYSAKLEAQDVYFDRRTQAELVRRAMNVDAGVNCSEHELIETE